jgi:lipoprotein-anchoring transpeptidase ErfK/SrfK
MAPTPGFARKLATALTLGASWAVLTGAAPAQAVHPRIGQGIQRLAILERTHDVFSTSDHRSSRLTALAARRPITGERTVLPVLSQRTGADGRPWLQVMLPGRPNGRTGWISPRATRPATTAWRLLVELFKRRVTVFRDGRVLRAFRAVVGKPSTPTPRGRFFVEEDVRLSADRTGAPFALALSARSDVLQEFDGGPGQIALHGLGNIGGVPGTAASHGCVRLDGPAISWLAARIGPGVPVTIVA